MPRRPWVNRDAPTPDGLLFVIESTEGGAFSSTAELCGQIAGLGHGVAILHQSAPSRSARLYRRATNFEVKLGRRPAVEGLNRGWGNGVRSSPNTGSVPTYSAGVVENGLRRLLVQGERPRAVVASAVSRVAVRRLRQDCTAYGIPLVLYMRSHTSLGHLELGVRPDLVLVNSPALVEPVRERGFDVDYIPSVIDLEPYRVPTRREAVLVINPIPAYGSELALEIAAAAPDLSFEFRESHSMPEAHRRHLEARLAALPNAHFLGMTTDPAELYGNAAILMIPYPPGDLLSNRPRIVAEAFAAGIPVVCSDIPGLRMAAGDGGVFLPAHDAGAWARELQNLLANEERYLDLSERVRLKSLGADYSPQSIAEQFLQRVEAIARV